jgi:hypothetical protein
MDRCWGGIAYLGVRAFLNTWNCSAARWLLSRDHLTRDAANGYPLRDDVYNVADMKARIARFGLTTLLYLFVPATVDAAGPPHRDLAGYDKVGVDYTHSQEPVVLDRGLRNFVYDHWKQRRRAFILIRSLTAEGRDMVDMTKQLFIEPGKDRSWCVHGAVEAAVSELRWGTRLSEEATQTCNKAVRSGFSGTGFGRTSSRPKRQDR